MKGYDRYDATSERVYVESLDAVPWTGKSTFDTEPEQLVPLYRDCELGRFFYYADEARDLGAIGDEP